MGSSKALRSMVLAALAALLGAALAGPAVALPVPTVEGDDTNCFLRASAGDAGAFTDAVNGNFWARRDVFTVDPETECSAFVAGISVFVKTPLQVDSTPEWNDLDLGNNSLADLTAAMRALPEADGFHPSFTGLGFNEGNGGAPTGAFANTFQAVRICLAVSGSITVASCLAGSPMVLTDIGGGYMIFTIELGEDSFSLDAFEGDNDFQLVTIVHSDVLGPVPGNDLPELLVGWRFVPLVPEPGLALLLAPALLLALRRRRAS